MYNSERMFHPQFGFGTVLEAITTNLNDIHVVRFDVPTHGETEFRVFSDKLEPESVRMARFSGDLNLAAELAARLTSPQPEAL
jgi:hypothetical protein